MAKVTYVLAQGENSAGESQVNFRVYVSRELRVRVPSGIWVDRKRWGKKNDINIPNIPGEERDALLAKRAKLKELVPATRNCNKNPVINDPRIQLL